MCFVSAACIFAWTRQVRLDVGFKPCVADGTVSLYIARMLLHTYPCTPPRRSQAGKDETVLGVRFQSGPAGGSQCTAGMSDPGFGGMVGANERHAGTTGVRTPSWHGAARRSAHVHACVEHSAVSFPSWDGPHT